MQETRTKYSDDDELRYTEYLPEFTEKGKARSKSTSDVSGAKLQKLRAQKYKSAKNTFNFKLHARLRKFSLGKLPQSDLDEFSAISEASFSAEEYSPMKDCSSRGQLNGTPFKIK